MGKREKLQILHPSPISVPQNPKNNSRRSMTRSTQSHLEMEQTQDFAPQS
jgi:hypothetical protein